MDTLESLLKDIMVELQTALRTEADAQGHRNTGKLSDSIRFEISADGIHAVGRMYVAEYGIYVNVGVTADRIPFGKGGGTPGGTSQYIQGLIEYWEDRGLSGREAIGAAFALAHVHEREGMPSRASYQYSSTGERTGFVNRVLEKHIPDIEKRLSEKYGLFLVGQINEIFREHNFEVQP